MSSPYTLKDRASLSSGKPPVFVSDDDNIPEDIAERTTLVVREQRIIEGRPLGYAARKMTETTRMGRGMVVENAKISVESDIVVENGAFCSGTLSTTENILVDSASVEGSITCDALVLKGTAQVSGNVRANRVFVTGNSFLTGKITVRDVTVRNDNAIIDAEYHSQPADIKND